MAQDVHFAGTRSKSIAPTAVRPVGILADLKLASPRRDRCAGGRKVMEEIDYEKWALDMCSLLDAIEKALSDSDYERAKTLTLGRFDMAGKYGLKVVFTGIQAGGIQ